MRNITIFLLLIVMLSCSKSAKKGEIYRDDSFNSKEDTVSIVRDSIEEESYEENLNISFRNTQDTAILIGDSIILLNQNLEPIENIPFLSGKIVEVFAVSDTLFNNSDEFCDAFYYAKIKTEKWEGLVDGRQVFKIESSKQDTSIFVNGGRIEILTTNSFGIGVVFDEGITGCYVKQPILIRDIENNYFGLVDVIVNEHFKESTWNHDFLYHEIRDDDGMLDRIDSIIISDSNILLKMHRVFQEGYNHYDVLLKYDQGRYLAEFLNYGDIIYE